MKISPSVGLYTPVSMLKIVVLPAPFGPISPTSSCGSMVRLKSETAVSPPNRIVTCFASSSCMRLLNRRPGVAIEFVRGVAFVAWIVRNRVLAPGQHVPQLAASEQTLGTGEHQDDEHDRVDDHARILRHVQHALGHPQALGQH